MKLSMRQSTVRIVGVTVALAALIAVGCKRESETSAPGASSGAAMEQASTPARPSLEVSVSLTPAMAKKAGPSDVVYVYARAVNGPRVPVAIVRTRVRDLRMPVVLNDSNAMDPALRMSSVPEVIVTARVSKSGDATPKPGDLEGTSAPVKTSAATVAVSISKVVTAR